MELPSKERSISQLPTQQYQPTRDELLAENQSLFEEMSAMEIQHEQTLTAAVEALEKSARERRALERQVAELHAGRDLLETEREQWTREREQLKAYIEEIKKDHQSASTKAITALKDREQMKLQMISIEGETAKLLDWLIEEGKILEKLDDNDSENNESDCEPNQPHEDAEEDEGSLLDLKEKLERKVTGNIGTFVPRFSKSTKGKKIGSNKLGQSSSLSTLYANALQQAGIITSSMSHNRLVASNTSIASMASTDSMAAINPQNPLILRQMVADGGTLQCLISACQCAPCRNCRKENYPRV
ncbi:hypothetical protein BDR26DRAFT_225900 [Obelidium mucronatum]|nr:hypothetical protein BDR26DRAFT_225900 [Obelidium mucronatum]